MEFVERPSNWGHDAPPGWCLRRFYHCLAPLPEIAERLRTRVGEIRYKKPQFNPRLTRTVFYERTFPSSQLPEQFHHAGEEAATDTSPRNSAFANFASTNFRSSFCLT